MKSLHEIAYEAARFKKEVNAGMNRWFYEDSPDAETVTELRTHPWGFYYEFDRYEFDRVPCAVVYTDQGLEDHADVGLAVATGVPVPSHHHVLYSTIDGLITGVLLSALEGFGAGGTQDQVDMLESLRIAAGRDFGTLRDGRK